MWIYVQTVLWVRWGRQSTVHSASTEKTGVMLTFSKKLPWNGTAGETDLWREMNFVRSAELYTHGLPHLEYLFLVLNTFFLFPRHYTNWHKVVVAVCVWAVEAVLRRLLFQFKYMPTREVIIHRLGAEHHEESSTVIQGTMIWFLINTVVRVCAVSVSF